MFDSLKDKLGSFRKDVEETAEENAEPVDDEELEDLDEEDVPDLDEEELEDLDEEELESPPTDERAGDELEGGRADEGGPADAADRAGEAAQTGATAGDTDPKRPHASTDPTATEPDDVATTPAETGADSDAGGGWRGPFGSDDADSTPDTDADSDPEESTVEDEAEVESDDDDGGNTGFGAKAKSLVRGKFVIEEEDLEGPLQDLELALLSSDVEMSVAEQILENIEDELVGETRAFTESTGAVVEDALREAILEVISVGQFDFDERVAIADKPLTIIFTGVNGVGKTTTIAKLSRYLEERGYSTVMANGDTYRAGANEQIQEHAEALDTKLISHQQGGDPAAVIYDAVEYAEANDVDVVLGDTAGRLHTDEGLMDQLEKIDRVVGPDMTLFVDEAVAGQDAVNRARKFDEAATIDGAVLTKADADANGGAAISIAHVTGKPILFLGVGQGYDDLERFDPERMADRLLETDEE